MHYAYSLGRKKKSKIAQSSEEYNTMSIKCVHYSQEFLFI